jgi:cleavage and polyadenylation specificity factor subunit 2
VLLSHSDLAHAGGLSYAFSELGLNCPVYATLPVAKLALLTLRDAQAALAEESDSPLLTPDDVSRVFQQRVHELKYLQPVELPARDGIGADIVVTAYPAGHSVGGAVWKGAWF